METTLEAAARVLATADRILVFTGAGISTESGIPDFRGPDGLWTKVDPDDFTIQRYLTSRRVRVDGWKMHQQGSLWGARSTVAPNAAHHAIVDLWRAGRLAGCATQNIDGLHQAAGLPDDQVAELHGNIRKATCIDCGQQWTTEEILLRVDGGDEDPHCLDCGGLIKTTTVLFGEHLPAEQMQRAALFAATADAVLAVGTTLSVFPAAEIPLGAARRVPLVIVNLGETEGDRVATAKVEAKAGEALTALAATLT